MSAPATRYGIRQPIGKVSTDVLRSLVNDILCDTTSARINANVGYRLITQLYAELANR